MKSVNVEFHCHTRFSPDSLLSVKKILLLCDKRSIDKVAITDHNTIEGALLAKEMAPERIIVGEEIMTTGGELLGYFLSERISPGLSPLETIEQLRSQGAFICMAHPFDKVRKGHWRMDVLMEILPLVDAIETFNARTIWPGFNRMAREFAESHHVSGIVGSDAHMGIEVGRATMTMADFNDAQSLKVALPHAQEKYRRSSLWVHMGSRYAAWRKSRE